MERRAVVGGSLLAGLSTLMSPDAFAAGASAEAASAAVGDLEGVSDSIDQLRLTVEHQFATVYTDKWQVRRESSTAATHLDALDAEISGLHRGWTRCLGQHLRLARRVSAAGKHDADVRRPLHDGVHVHDAIAAPRSGAGLRRLRLRRRQRAAPHTLGPWFSAALRRARR